MQIPEACANPEMNVYESINASGSSFCLQARTFKTWPRHIFFLSCGQISEGTSPTCSEGCYFLSPGQNGNSSHMIWHQSIQTGIQIEMFRPILYVYFCRCIHDISMQIFLTPIASTNYTSIARVGNNNCLAHASGSKCWPFKCMYRKKT